MTAPSFKEGDFMNRSSLPLGLNSLKKWWDSPDRILQCNLPFQRHSGMWNAITKSMLVWSILADSFIPPIVLLKDKTGTDSKNKDIFTYQILDGQQRLTTLFSFMNDEWCLHGSTPEVEVDNTTYDLGGIKYSEMSAECQDAVKSYRFTVQCLENYTMSEAESLFYNINSGVSLSTIQKSKAKLGTDLISFLNGLLTGNFFTQAINISEKQALAEDDLLLLLQGMLLLDNRYEDREYKNISTATCLSYAESIRGNYSAEKRQSLIEIIQYLDEAFDSKVKFLKKNNVPIVIVMADIAKEDGRDAKSFKAFINDFANGVYPAYEEASGSGNVKAVKVQQRLRVMYIAMCSYYGIEPSEALKPFAGNIPLYPEGRAVDDLVGGAEPISGVTGSGSDEPSPESEWAGKSFGELGSISEASDKCLGDISLISETAEEASGEDSFNENAEINQEELSSDVQSEEGTEKSDGEEEPASGVASDAKEEAVSSE